MYQIQQRIRRSDMYRGMARTQTQSGGGGGSHEWARLKKSRGQQVYMRHAARANQAQAAALALALRGKKGAHVYAEVVQ